MNELIFNGKNFTEFNAYYATSNFLDGAAKDVQSVSVVGRSGDLQLSNNRYKNLSLKIRVYVTRDMEASMRAMRNYLESVHGYARVEISDQPNEFRMAAFKEMFAPDSYDSKVGVVDLTFDSMPQRFLKTGENWTTVSSSSSEISGNPVSISNPSGLTALTGLSVDIEPVQDLNGYDHPWVGGAGKNKLPLTVENIKRSAGGTWVGNSLTQDGITFTIQTDDNGNVTGILANGTSTKQTWLTVYGYDLEDKIASGNYLVSGASGGSRTSYFIYGYLLNGGSSVTVTGSDVAVALDNTKTFNVSVQIANGYTANNVVFKLMIRLASETDATYAPYENICPITGHTSATVTRTVDGSSTDYTIDLNGTIYGGTLDVSTGVLTVTHEIYTVSSVDSLVTKTGFIRVRSTNPTEAYASSTNEKNAITNNMVFNYTGIIGFNGNTSVPFSFYVSGSYTYFVLPTTAATDLASANAWFANNQTTVVYPLATPTTVQLTPQQVSLLTGTNILSTDMNSMTVTIASPAELENPTLFESKPLIRVYGNGALNINDIYITVANNPYTYIDIDCELMDCYYGSNNANQYVSFSTTDYVTLRSGTNYFSYSGFTSVQVTPRWFEI